MQLSKIQVQGILKNAPQGSNPKDIINGLLSRGYTLEGLQAPQATTQTSQKISQTPAPVSKTKSFFDNIGAGLSQTGTDLKDLATGAMKGVASTAIGAGSLVQQGLNATVGKGIDTLSGGKTNIAQIGGSDVYKPDTKTGQDISTALKPTNYNQGVGKTIEQLGEFALPSGAEGDVLKAIDTLKGGDLISGLTKLGVPAHIGTFLANTGKMGLKMLTQGVTGFGITAAQEGKVGGDAETSGLIGASMSPIGAGFSKLSKAVPALAKFTTGVEEGAVKEAQNSPNTVKQGMKMTAGDIRDKADTALTGLYKDMRSTFSDGLDALQKSTPFQAASKQFNNVRSFFGTTLNDVKAGIPSIFRDFRVAVEDGGKTLNFDKLNSSIIKPAEQRGLQAALDTIQRQTDYSPKGIQAVAARLEALTKYGENNETSSIITKMKDAYDAAIVKHYPQLAELRATYGKTAQQLEDIQSIVGSKFDSPQKIQTAVTKLQSIFNTDKENYLKIVQDLAKRSGINFPALIASDQFKKVLPDFLRGIGGAGIAGVSAHLINPFGLLLAPLFSPNFVGKLITNENVVSGGAKLFGNLMRAEPSVVNNQANQ